MLAAVGSPGGHLSQGQSILGRFPFPWKRQHADTRLVFAIHQVDQHVFIGRRSSRCLGATAVPRTTKHCYCDRLAELSLSTLPLSFSFSLSFSLSLLNQVRQEHAGRQTAPQSADQPVNRDERLN